MADAYAVSRRAARARCISNPARRARGTPALPPRDGRGKRRTAVAEPADRGRGDGWCIRPAVGRHCRRRHGRCRRGGQPFGRDDRAAVDPDGGRQGRCARRAIRLGRLDPSLTATQELLAAADVVIAVGTELAETDHWTDRLPIKGKLIRIDVDPPPSCATTRRMSPYWRWRHGARPPSASRSPRGPRIPERTRSGPLRDAYCRRLPPLLPASMPRC